MAQVTERVQQVLELLQAERDGVEARLVELNMQVENYITSFDNVPNEQVVKEARKDHRFARSVWSPMHTSAGECLHAMKQWKERDLGVDVVRLSLYRLNRASRALKGEDEDE